MSGIVPIGQTPVFISEASGPLSAGATLASSETRGTEGLGGPAGAENSTALGSFGSFLGDAVDQANRLDQAASRKVDALASGAADDLHGTMISAKEAEISIKLVGTVRNKILDAFQELWRTSV
jgi:flagellar hook-basal body complex protein FliE